MLGPPQAMQAVLSGCQMRLHRLARRHAVLGQDGVVHTTMLLMCRLQGSGDQAVARRAKLDSSAIRVPQ